MATAWEPPCSFGSILKTPCGCSNHYPSAQDLIPITECTRNVYAHLRRVGLSTREDTIEWKLILERCGFFEPQADHDWREFLICPLHRDQLGAYWKDSNTCKHPLHGEAGKKKAERSVSSKMSREIYKKWNILIPAGSGNILRN